MLTPSKPFHVQAAGQRVTAIRHGKKENRAKKARKARRRVSKWCELLN